jgi:putative tricarboxylic transport membrane protein
MSTDLLFSVFKELMEFQTIVAILIGIVGGMIIGALPGLSGTMGVALLIPFTFGMNPIAGLTMLTIIYTTSTYGGSFSAILLHTPGTPSNAATTIEGYQMTLQGKGLKALGIATVSSVIGGTFSAICLLLIAPPLAQISLKFAAPEYLLVALFGLTIIGSLSSGSILKGIISGVLGLCIATIGTDLATGFPRFTFGTNSLMSGINIIPAMIGFFSISQVMILSQSIGEKVASVTSEIKGRTLPTWAEFKRILPTIIRSSFIGVFIGILPGAGGDIGSWVAYNEAKRFSKHPEEFGKGSIEGLAGCESANNAVTGGAIIPMLTLGIPGSALTAVLMGGLLIQGLRPGHELFTVHAQTTYAVMIGFLIANLLMGVFGLILAPYIVKVAQVPQQILTTVIVVLSVVGAYTMSNNIFDVYVAIFFGLLGFLMRKYNFNPAPVVLALVLGPLVENSYTQTLVMCKGNFLGYILGRPLCIVLLVLIIMSLLTPLIMSWRQKTKSGLPSVSQENKDVLPIED